MKAKRKRMMGGGYNNNMEDSGILIGNHPPAPYPLFSIFKILILFASSFSNSNFPSLKFHVFMWEQGRFSMIPLITNLRIYVCLLTVISNMSGYKKPRTELYLKLRGRILNIKVGDWVVFIISSGNKN